MGLSPIIRLRRFITSLSTNRYEESLPVLLILILAFGLGTIPVLFAVGRLAGAG